MPFLANKKILLGVTGGIAAYKTPELVRLLVKQGASVQVVMTPSAHKFVTAETLSVVSGKPVYTEFFNGNLGQWNNHVELGLWPDLILIAPATATSIAKLCQSMADNLLLATVMSSRCQVMLAPAMDLDMLVHPGMQRNLEQLKKDGCIIMEPATGELASGLQGKGRMPEPSEIVDYICNLLRPELFLSGKKVLITSGPTHENIDPVRFIGNHSTGKMGYALADSFLKHGAEVHLVSGPVNIPAPEGVQVYPVQSAMQMLDQCTLLADGCDIMLMAAAVADYRPETVAEEKIKKSDAPLTIHLVKNPDILATLSSNKKPGQFVAGFALETQNEFANAVEKLERKKLDMIVLNSLNDDGAGFGFDTNKATLIFADKKAQELPLMNKSELAEKIVSSIAEKLNLLTH